MIKTNVMRILDQYNIEYTAFEYSTEDGKIDGVSVANKMKQPVEIVFKTLVTISKANEPFVFIIPVHKELDLKKAASASGQKSIDMLPQNKLLPLTGYVHGGCSPVGMKKLYKSYIDESAILCEEIIVSGGKIGAQVKLAPDDLLKVIAGNYASFTRS